MSDSRAALDPDRLPWLTDDLPRGRRAWTSVLLLAILATLLLAGVSYWLGMQSVRRAADVTSGPAPTAAPLPIVRPQPLPPAANADQVVPPAMPEVAPVAEPEVVPPRVTDARPAQPRLPLEQQEVAPPPSTALAKPPPARPPPPPATTAASQPRSGVQSRASFNCRLARARWEIAVCNNGNLAALDRDLAALTSDVTARADAGRRARLARTRDRFVARRNACQTDACTNAVYVARLREVSGIMTDAVTASPPPSSTPSPSAAPAQARPARPSTTAATATPTPKTAPPKATTSKPTPANSTPAQPSPPKASSPSAARPRAITQSRASFDCRLARTRGEIAVCNNGNLGLLDRQLALLYSQAWGRADAAKRSRLLRTRDRFLARRDACVSEMCTRIAYENRMRQVSDIMVGVDRQP